ncbi:MAG: hypothetical protein LBT92_03685 [Rickettsiales bacterium]|jgi:hypothetical protein|nr:hypothetical protein [Rickettsiales bacterium]
MNKYNIKKHKDYEIIFDEDIRIFHLKTQRLIDLYHFGWGKYELIPEYWNNAHVDDMVFAKGPQGCRVSDITDIGSLKNNYVDIPSYFAAFSERVSRTVKRFGKYIELWSDFMGVPVSDEPKIVEAFGKYLAKIKFKYYDDNMAAFYKRPQEYHFLMLLWNSDSYPEDLGRSFLTMDRQELIWRCLTSENASYLDIDMLTDKEREKFAHLLVNAGLQEIEDLSKDNKRRLSLVEEYPASVIRLGPDATPAERHTAISADWRVAYNMDNLTNLEIIYADRLRLIEKKEKAVSMGKTR